MPIIPRNTEQVKQQSSAPVQLASTGDVRLQGDAIEKLGSAVTQFGQQQIAIDRKLKTDEFQSEIHNTAQQAKAYADKNASADGSDYGDKYYEYAQPALNQSMDKYAGADPALRRDFSSYVSRLRGDIDTSIMITSGQMMEKNNFDRLDKSGDASADRLRQSPTPQMVDAESRTQGALLNGIVDTGGMSAENAAKVKSAFDSKLARSFIQGLAEKQQFGKIRNYLSSVQATGIEMNDSQTNNQDHPLFTDMDPRQAADLGLIDSREAQGLIDKGEMHKLPVMTKADKVGMTPAIQKMLDGLTPSEKAYAFEHAQAQLKAQANVRMADQHQAMQATLQLAFSGDPNLTEKHFADAKASINSNPNMTEIARARSFDQLNSAKAVWQTLQLAQTTPRSEWGNLLTKANTNIENEGLVAGQKDPRMSLMSADPVAMNTRSDAIGRLQQSLSQVASQQDHDAASSVIAANPEVATLWKGTKDGKGFDQYATTLLSNQNHLGVPPDKQRLLPLSESQSKAQQLSAMPDADSTNDMLAQMQSQYGRFFPQVMGEIAKVDKNLADYKVVSMVEPSRRGPMIDAIRNQEAVQKALKQDPDRLGERAKTVNALAATSMQPFSRALGGLSMDSAGVETANTLTGLVALQATRELVRNPNVKAQDAVAKAKADIVDANFTVVDGGSSSILVPRRIGNYIVNSQSEGIFRTFMDVYSKPENLQEKFAAYVPPNQNPNQYLSSAIWTTNQSQTGLQLVKPRPGGGMDAVIDKYGKPIGQSYTDIFQTTDKKVVSANKTVFQKLFGD